jgi:hypothetical protein
MSMEVNRARFCSSNYGVTSKVRWGTRQPSCLRHYATSRKVAGSIPNEVIGFFNRRNHCSRIMAQGSTQPLTEMSTRNHPWG